MYSLDDKRLRPVNGSSGSRLSERPTGELMKELFDHAGALLREEVHLAKIELRDEARRLGRASAVLGAGGVVAHAAFFCLCATAIAALSLAMPVWLAAFLVGVVTAGVAAICIQRGRSALKQVTFKPETTIQTLQEDKQWLKETIRAGRSKTSARV